MGTDVNTERTLKMNKNEFVSLFKNNYALLYKLAFSMLHDTDDSHDAVHEVFASAWEHRKDILPETAKAYLAQSVHNYCVKQIARKTYNEKLRKLYPIEVSLTLNKHEDDRLREIKRYIDNDLPPNTRQVLQMCFDEEKSYKETAEQLQCSVAYVNKHIVKALRMLRNKFTANNKER
ncbi:MAG: sigma-70 family RNA polymerase sigma factor [Bacteroidaceae bacterium]|nr:sigma-70 family RNA polymerase sigma factor [Bacteroidaceae bacterium]